ARDEIARCVIDKSVQGTAAPDVLEHGVDPLGLTDVANEVGSLAAARRPLRYRPLQHLFAPPADHDLCAKLEKTGPQALADARPPAGDENLLLLEHSIGKQIGSLRLLLRQHGIAGDRLRGGYVLWQHIPVLDHLSVFESKGVHGHQSLAMPPTYRPCTMRESP